MKIIRARGWHVIYVLLGNLGVVALWLHPRDWIFKIEIYDKFAYFDFGPLQTVIMRKR